MSPVIAYHGGIIGIDGLTAAVNWFTSIKKQSPTFTVQQDWEKRGKGKKKSANCLPSKYRQPSIGGYSLLWSHTCSTTPGGALGDRAQKHVGSVVPKVY